jgi:hypothetical protein
MKVDPVIGAAGCFQVYTHFLFISGYTVNVPDSYSITGTYDGCKVVGFMNMVHDNGEVGLAPAKNILDLLESFWCHIIR